jgi:hypothetical protein
MNESNSLDQLNSLKDSYFNILASFLEKEKIDSRFVRCLLKWGFQLKLTPDDILQPKKELESIQFINPSNKVDRLEAIFHLVQMIYLDQTVEDVELELAGVYAERLGFKKEVVADLFKSIATESSDEQVQKDVHQEVIDFLTLNEDLIS